MRVAKILAVLLPLGLCAIAVAPTSSADDPAPCDWQLEYSLAANLKLTDTPMGEGNGVYPVGPGRVVLRLQDRGGQPGGSAQLLEYRMREHFTVHSKTLFWTTTVLTDTRSSATPDACSIAAEGALDADRVLRWQTPVRGYRTDGMLTCSGSLCGKFGAPPPGESALHIGPEPVPFKPFVFSPDLRTFTMQTTHISTTSMPKQSSEIALAGREVRRACVPIPKCSK